MFTNRLRYPLLFGLTVLLVAACNSLFAEKATKRIPDEQVVAGQEETDASAAGSIESEADLSTEEPVVTNEDDSEILALESAEATSEPVTGPQASTNDESVEGEIVAPAPSGKSLQPQLAQADINLNEVVTLLPPDAIRAVAPEEVPKIMVTAEEAKAGSIDPAVRVIGVSINGESHAYPIPFLSRHEIVNTELGGKLIAATW